MKNTIKKVAPVTLITALLFSASLEVSAMGSKKPAPAPAPKPPATTPTPPTTPPVSSTRPTLDFGTRLEADAYLEASAQSGAAVDDNYNSSALMKRREMVNADQVDKCFSDEDEHAYFSDQISYYTAELLNDTPAMVGFIGSYYGTSSNDASYFPTSLIRHPLCTSSSASLGKTINKVPSSSVITKLNNFSSEVNSLRQAVLNGDQSAKTSLLNTWSRFFSCLAYTESLSTADSAASQAVANRVAPAGYRKPAGVKFYDDPAQSEASRLNIGTFQFTPTASGNIQPCLKAWNALHARKPTCQVSTGASKSELIKVLGSSLQSFNAFCGVHKLVQTFAIQVNTNKASATHPSNLVNGKLKPFEQRCVTPHFQSGRAYNHFGPFQNSTGSNMNSLFSCVEKSR